MNEEGDSDKSEQATPFKLQRARERGAVARGMDLGFVAALASAVVYFWVNGPSWKRMIELAFRQAFVTAPEFVDSSAATWAFASVFTESAWAMLHMLGLIFGGVLLAEFLQVGPVFSLNSLKPDFKKLNPASGLKKIFTRRQLLETLKNVAKLVAYSALAWLLITRVYHSTVPEMGNAPALVSQLSVASFRLGASFLGIAAVLAVLDQIISRRDFSRRMRMSRREVRREHRDREGDARLKQKRKQMHGEFIKQSQSLRGIAGADVLIANPEHLALGLRYDARTMSAPFVVSIGTNAFAQRLKRLAAVYGVTVIEDRVLARDLYRHASLNKPVPDRFFSPVAEIYNKLNRSPAIYNGENEDVIPEE